ncbi:MAG: hypothetical protein LBG90_07935, partial [Spirochaetaceae bacterium]|nr:hypothetical protein [Spirochaetaceae bacterium]
ELPSDKSKLSGTTSALSVRAKSLLKDLANISLEIAQMTVNPERDAELLPDWFMVEIVRDLPRLAEKKKK